MKHTLIFALFFLTFGLQAFANNGTCTRSASGFSDLYSNLTDVSQVTASYGSVPSDPTLMNLLSLAQAGDPLAQVPQQNAMMQVAQNGIAPIPGEPNSSGEIGYWVNTKIGTNTYTGETLYGNHLYMGPVGATSINQLRRPNN